MTTSDACFKELLTNFAEKHHLRVQYDGCDDLVIAGKQGQLYEYNYTELGLMIQPPGSSPRPRLWNTIRERCLAGGMTLRQNGDAEGALSFNPADHRQAKLAIQMAKARPKRQMSEPWRQRQLAILAKARLARKNSIRGGLQARSSRPKTSVQGELWEFWI